MALDALVKRIVDAGTDYDAVAEALAQKTGMHWIIKERSLQLYQAYVPRYLLKTDVQESRLACAMANLEHIGKTTMVPVAGGFYCTVRITIGGDKQ